MSTRLASPNRNRVVACIAALALLGAAQPATQATEARAVRLALAGYILHHAPEVPWLRGRYLYLSARPLDAWYDTAVRAETGKLVMRSVTEVDELAREMGATVARDDNTANCRVTSSTGLCEDTGNNGAMVRIGEPRIAGDSAVLVYGVSRLGGAVRLSEPLASQYVVWLHRFASGWRVTMVREVRGTKAGPLFYVNSDTTP